MGFWGTLFSGGGLTTEFMKQYGKDQAMYQDKLNEVNYKWTRKARQTQWQDTVQSMQEAGINPALAYTSGSTTSDMTPTQSQAENPLTTMMGLASQIGALGKVGAEVKQLNETTELTRQQQISEQINQDLGIAKTFNQWAEGILKDKQANWYDKRQAIEYKQIAEQIANLSSSTLLNKAKINSEVTLQGLQKEQARYQKGRTALLGKEKGYSNNAGHKWNIFGIGAGKDRSESYQYYD